MKRFNYFAIKESAHHTIPLRLLKGCKEIGYHSQPFSSKSYFSNSQKQAVTVASLESEVSTVPLHLPSPEEKNITRRVSWMVKEESASIVIKAEMNDGFRGCGVDRFDDRRAEGPLQF